MPYFFLKQRDLDNKFDLTDVKFTVDAVLADEVVEEFEKFLLASGFQRDSILRAFYERASELDEE